MISSLLIIGFSLVLLVYWCRYTCLLLLRNAQAEVSDPVPDDPRLSSRRVRTELGTAPNADLGPLQQALDRDYAILAYLLDHAAGISLNPVERRLFSADYRVMSLYCRLTRSFAPAAARDALLEMASVVGVLSQRMGRQTAE